MPPRPVRVLALLLAASLSGGCVSYVRQGHVGLLIDNFTGEVRSVMEPGIRISAPITQHLVEFPVIVQQYVMVKNPGHGPDASVRVNSLEGQTFQVDASVEFVILEKKAVPPLYQRYGLNFDEIVENYYRSKFKSALANSFASLPLVEAIQGNGRRRVEQLAAQELAETMKGDPIRILQVLIRAVYVPDTIANSIADKTRAENDLMRARTTAEQQIVEAQAHARAQVIQAEADAKARLIRAKAEAQANREVAASLTERLLRKIYVERLSDRVQLVIPEKGLFNFNGLLREAEGGKEDGHAPR